MSSMIPCPDPAYKYVVTALLLSCSPTLFTGFIAAVSFFGKTVTISIVSRLRLQARPGVLHPVVDCPNWIQILL